MYAAQIAAEYDKVAPMCSCGCREQMTFVVRLGNILTWECAGDHQKDEPFAEFKARVERLTVKQELFD